MNYTKCKECGTEFSYKLVGTAYPGYKSPGDVECPKCGTVQFHVMTSQFVIVEKTEEKKNRKKKNKTINKLSRECQNDVPLFVYLKSGIM